MLNIAHIQCMTIELTQFVYRGRGKGLVDDRFGKGGGLVLLYATGCVYVNVVKKCRRVVFKNQFFSFSLIKEKKETKSFLELFLKSRKK